MGLVRSGLWTLAGVGLFGFVSVAGCSADGSVEDVGGDTPATEPTGGAQLPPPSGTDASEPVDSSTKPDAGPKKEAGVDAGPPPPNPGDACTTPDEIREKKCGACGEQSTICIGGKWTEYSACSGELAGGCVPGTVEQEACGNCGTLTKTCTQYCAWQKTACGGQPANSCTPGAVELSAAGCTTADTYRQRSCPGTCAWNAFSMTCSAPPTTIEVAPTAGGTTSTVATLAASQTAGRLGGSCPNATISTTVTTPYVYLSVHNPNAKEAVVTLFTSQAPGGMNVKTVLAAYAGTATPSTDAARKACTKGTNSFGDSTITGSTDFASLDGTDAVTIPAGGTVRVYLAGELATSTGTVKFSARTDKLN
jgi:hypothetical protein